MFSSYLMFNKQQPTLQRNLDLCISRKGIARPQSQFPHSCVFEQSTYTYYPRSVHLLSCSRISRRSGEYIKRSQKHECRNWDCMLRSSFTGNICFEFSVLCLCSAATTLEPNSVETRFLVNESSVKPFQTRSNSGTQVTQ
jgi:hypothetical protein